MTEVEEWRDVVGFEGLYEVSDQGRIRNVARGMGRTFGKILKPSPRGRYGHLTVTLRKDGKGLTSGVHRHVCRAFHGPAPDEEHDNALHWDGDVTNNRPENLRWGTRKDNANDSIRHGTRRNQYFGSTHCEQGHEWTEEHLYTNPRTGQRRCMTCQKTPPPPGDPRHGKYTTYGTSYCRCLECTEAWRLHCTDIRNKRKGVGRV